MSEENGTNVTPLPNRDPRGSRIANRTVWLDLAEPFDNLQIKAWLDYPREVAVLWTPIDGETTAERGRRTILASRETFLEHRGRDNGEPWEDEDGVLPPPTEQEFWERIPTPLGGAIITAFYEELSGNRRSRVSRKKMKPRFGRSSS